MSTRPDKPQPGPSRRIRRPAGRKDKAAPLTPLVTPRRVLICPDKFKGTLTATQAAGSIAAGWRRVRPADVLELLPISDGGDGFGELLGQHLGAEARTCDTVDAAHRPIQATWWWHAAERTAIIESARVIGLAMLPAGRFHPFELDSFGLGLLLKQVSACKPARWIIGLGGSATNDAGFGLARGLGWRFLDRQGQAIEQWTQLTGLHRLVGRSTTLHARGNAAVAVDVQNPLLGRKGATRVYGPQKGIRPEDVKPAEAAHARLVEVARRQYGVEGHLAGRRGAGAAGGLGFGLELFFAAAMEPGFDLFAQSVGLASRVATANVVLTGEGAIDETTLSMGKGVGGVGRLCRRLRRPCLALGGVVADAGRAARKFTLVRALAPDLTSPADARENAARWLTELAARVAADWQP